MSRRYFTRWYLGPLAALLAGGPMAAQGTTATIRGQVTDSSSQRPVAGAQVIVMAGGTARGARAGENGQYAIAGLPAGAMVVRIRFVGFEPAEQTIAVRDGETRVVNFALTPRSTQLDQVVVTGT